MSSRSLQSRVSSLAVENESEAGWDLPSKQPSQLSELINSDEINGQVGLDGVTDCVIKLSYFLCRLHPSPPIYSEEESVNNKDRYPTDLRAHGGTVVEAVRYKLEGHSFNSQWCRWIFFIEIIFPVTLALGSTRPLTEMSTRNIS
jgi:hypothetical protein